MSKLYLFVFFIVLLLKNVNSIILYIFEWQLASFVAIQYIHHGCVVCDLYIYMEKPGFFLSEKGMKQMNGQSTRNEDETKMVELR